MMSSQFNNCASMEKNELTVNDCQETFEDDPQWEVLAATVCKEIELEYLKKTSTGKSVKNALGSEDIKKD